MGLLADLIVTIRTEGADQLKSILGDAEKGLKKTSDSVLQLGTLLKAALIERAAGEVGSLVRQGLAASAMGQVLDFQMGRLSRTVAGLFGPEISKLIGFVEKLTGWINNLSDKQKQNIAHWIQGAAVALAFGAALPIVTSGLTAAAAAAQVLFTVIATGEAAIGDVLPLISALAGAFLALSAGTVVAQGGLGSLYAAVKPLIDKLLATAQKLGEVFAPLAPQLETLFGEVVALAETLTTVIGENADLLREAATAFITGLRIALDVMNIIVSLAGKLAAILHAAFGVSLLGPLGALAAWLDKQAGVKPVKIEPGPTGGQGELAKRTGGPASLESIWDRLAAASVAVGAGRSIEQQQLDEQKRTTEAAQQTRDAVKDQQRPFTR